jgi:hypothetical protein
VSLTVFRCAIFAMCGGWALFGGILVHAYHVWKRDH